MKIPFKTIAVIAFLLLAGCRGARLYRAPLAAAEYGHDVTSKTFAETKSRPARGISGQYMTAFSDVWSTASILRNVGPRFVRTTFRACAHRVTDGRLSPQMSYNSGQQYPGRMVGRPLHSPRKQFVAQVSADLACATVRRDAPSALGTSRGEITRGCGEVARDDKGNKPTPPRQP
jgi:hypothetical protein